MTNRDNSAGSAAANQPAMTASMQITAIAGFSQSLVRYHELFLLRFFLW